MKQKILDSEIFKHFGFKICVIFCCAFFAVFENLNAGSYTISPLPLPKQEVINLSISKCDKKCLNELYDLGQYFSFVARFGDENDPDLRAKFSLALQALAIIDIQSVKKPSGTSVKVALLTPKKMIGRHFSDSIDTILSYLMARGGDFSFEAYDTKTEDAQDIQAAYDSAVQWGADVVVGIFRNEGAKAIASGVKIKTPIYLPTINAHSLDGVKIPKNLYFGGVDYERQVEMILHLESGQNFVVYNDDSPVGEYLGEIFRNKNAQIAYEQTIDAQTAKRFSNFIPEQGHLIENNVVIFNTPSVRTGLMASQIGTSAYKPKRMYSTQVNFSPSLFELLGDKDKKEFYVVSMIGFVRSELVEYASLLGRDLKYNWVNYATAIGLELLLGAQNRYFSENFVDNQVQYTNRIYKISDKNFYESKR